MRVIETNIQKRFADIDMFRHVNNVHQQEYFDLGKTDYYRRVLGLGGFTGSPTLMIVSVKTDFAGQVRYEDDVVVRTWIERVGTKSITMRQQIVTRSDNIAARIDISTDNSIAGNNKPVTAETVCTESETVLVAFDLPSQQTLEIPEEWRARVE